eukprot:COSAG02_NODE_1281_length_13472_cov_8.763048_1_plen_80_part_00
MEDTEFQYYVLIPESNPNTPISGGSDTNVVVAVGQSCSNVHILAIVWRTSMLYIRASPRAVRARDLAMAAFEHVLTGNA